LTTLLVVFLVLLVPILLEQILANGALSNNCVAFFVMPFTFTFVAYDR